jgi:1-acyl-sn-glycerol-3-phosphate acyltransferase
MNFQKAMYWGSKPVVGTYTSTMIKMNVHMHEQFSKGAKIIAANHPSTTDPFYVAAIMRQQVYILIKDILFQVPILGEYLRRSGHIPVKEGEGAAALESALERLKAGETVVIFPEGVISPLEGGFHKAHTGVARLALMSGAPVIPIGIHLRRERIRSIRSMVKGVEEYGHWYISGPYYLTVGRAMRFGGDVEDRKNVRVVADKVMNRIIALAHESENRYNQTQEPISGALKAPSLS